MPPSNTMVDKATLDGLRIHRSDEPRSGGRAIWIAAPIVLLLAITAWVLLRGSAAEVKVAQARVV